MDHYSLPCDSLGGLDSSITPAMRGDADSLEGGPVFQNSSVSNFFHGHMPAATFTLLFLPEDCELCVVNSPAAGV